MDEDILGKGRASFKPQKRRLLARLSSCNQTDRVGIFFEIPFDSFHPERMADEEDGIKKSALCKAIQGVQVDLFSKDIVKLLWHRTSKASPFSAH